MIKKIFAILIFLSTFFVFAKTQLYFYNKNSDILKSEDKESLLEAAFPLKTIVKEIYGISNILLSPNEKVNSKTNATIKEEDGFLLQINTADLSIVENAKHKISELNEVCQRNGTEFSYIYFPSKDSDDKSLTVKYGVNSNFTEVREDFIEYLDENNIDYLDVGKLLENDGYTRKDIFYKTDHHWKTAAGLYAARAIGNYLNDQYGYELNVSAVEENQFTYTTYENLWFGETGRSMSLTWVNTLDDFTLIMPDYETSITLSSPGTEDVSGDFSIMVDTSGYSGDVDYYKYSAHYSYKEGISPTTFRNNLADENGKKILVIKDSFAVTVVPFLILETSEITVWDIRKEATKNGLYQYIEDNDFDVVLLAYKDHWQEKMWNFN